jgi:hypothetical protein
MRVGAKARDCFVFFFAYGKKTRKDGIELHQRHCATGFSLEKSGKAILKF